jgi:glycosyltransferase involved in cell wall biosynthesis|tara:strand:- start:1458 stop:2408 length:951 start_codon:yes stop_codon:yes gene_type:complete
MKITLIGPGIMPIPPTGWGACEILIWDTKLALEALGHEVQIINTKDARQIISEINGFRPDFVHVHYDEFIPIVPFIQYPNAITSHFGYLERREMFNGYINVANEFQRIKPNIFCLSEGIKKVYNVMFDIPKEKTWVTPNGVNTDAFEYVEDPTHPDRSIYLAKIDYRKRQHLFQSIESLWFAGNIADDRFNTKKNYLGEWSKDKLFNELTEYGNLVLLSDGEAHPLVCMEALAAGLGVVVCEWGKANLDTDKEFITVIPENKINDVDYVEEKIIENRKYSIEHRDEIREYGLTFDWKNVLAEHYIPAVEEVIAKHG